MAVKFDDYLYQGTKKILELCTSEGIGEEERTAIASVFAEELTAHVGDSDKLEDADRLINAASLQFVDGKISSILSKQNASYNDYTSGIELCLRQQKLLEYFKANGWDIPQIKNPNPQRCAELLQNRQDSISISTRIVEADRQIDKLLGLAQKELSTNICDQASKLISDLERDVAICKQKQIPLPAINNQDTKKLKKQLSVIRSNAEQKEALHQKIKAVDLKISSIVSNPASSPDQWRDIVTLCKQQDEQIKECQSRQWPVPAVRYSQVDKVSEQYSHYLNMLDVDSKITQDRYSLSSKKQYNMFFEYCNSLQDMLSTCVRNGWQTPILSNPNPANLINTVSSEKHKKDRRKKVKRGLVLTFVGLAAIAILVLFLTHKYKEGKIEIPFDSSYAIGMDQNDVYKELEDAGFLNITRKQDETGWLSDNTVIDVTIDNSKTFTKGSYRKPDVSVIVTYSSADRVNVTEILKGWQSKKYLDIEKILSDAGFTNITLSEEKTSDKLKDGLTSSIMLDNMVYSNQQCYLSKKAPIILTYFTLQIGIGYESSQFVGQNYEEVIAGLKESGFTNVQAQEVTTGWAAENTVLGVTVNNLESYNSSDSYAPDVKIVVKYSSGNRIDLTTVLKSWQTKDYMSLINSIKAKGFSTIQVKERTTEQKTQNLKVSSITIDGNDYISGDCHLPKTAAISIEYYYLIIRIGQDSSEIKEKEQYSELVKKLSSMGFSNIKLLRGNDLTTGWISDEGSIKDITINGASAFTAADTFGYDAEIIIVVHTFKNKGCEDITEIAEKK